LDYVTAAKLGKWKVDNLVLSLVAMTAVWWDYLLGKKKAGYLANQLA
jgi:hypothetical protein